MYKKSFRWFFWVGTLSAVALLGCGGSGALDTEYVEGVVTVDGEPVEDATVTFVPVTEGEGAPAVGVTNAQGVYRLTVALTGDVHGDIEAGTLPGEYYVGVVKTLVETPMSEEEAEELGVEYVPQPEDAGMEITHVVPQRYNDPRQSGIQVTVTTGRNTIPLELTSD